MLFRKSVRYGSRVTSCSVGDRPLHQSTSHFVQLLVVCVTSNCVWYKIRSVTNLGMFAVYEVPVTKQLVCRMTFRYCRMLWISSNLALLSQTMPCSLAAAWAAQRLTYWSTAVVQATRKCVCIRVTWRKNAAWLLQRNGGGGTWNINVRYVRYGKETEMCGAKCEGNSVQAGHKTNRSFEMFSPKSSRMATLQGHHRFRLTFDYRPYEGEDRQSASLLPHCPLF